VIREYYEVLNKTDRLNTQFKIIDDNVLFPSIVSISARPSVGKSLLVEQIGHAFVRNKFRWLSCQLELSPYEIIKREIVYNNVSKNNVNNYFIKTLNNPIDVVEMLSINNLYHTVDRYRQQYPNDKILVTIDHLFLIAGTENGKNLQPVFSDLVKLKKQGIYLIVLSHLKRDIYLPERCKEGHVNNRILENDIYMSDTILQYCDLSFAMDIPYRRGITLYSDAKVPVKKNNIIFSTLKNRNGDRLTYLYEINENLNFSFISYID